VQLYKPIVIPQELPIITMNQSQHVLLGITLLPTINNADIDKKPTKSTVILQCISMFEGQLL